MGCARVAFCEEGIDACDTLVRVVWVDHLREERLGFPQLRGVASEGCRRKQTGADARVGLASEHSECRLDRIGARVIDDFVECRFESSVANPSENHVCDQEEDERGDAGRDQSSDPPLERLLRRQDDLVDRGDRGRSLLDLEQIRRFLA